MSVGTGAAILGASALASAFGGKKSSTTQQSASGFESLPQPLQDLLMQQYLPKAQSTLNMPYQTVPMQRAQDPAGNPFASQGLWDLQKFSDAAGGLFTPYSGGANGQVNAGSYQGAAGNIQANGGSAQPAMNPAMGGAGGGAMPPGMGSGLSVVNVANNQSGRPFVSLSDGRMLPLNNFNNPNAVKAGASINPQTMQLMG